MSGVVTPLQIVNPRPVVASGWGRFAPSMAPGGRGGTRSPAAGPPARHDRGSPSTPATILVVHCPVAPTVAINWTTRVGFKSHSTGRAIAR